MSAAALVGTAPAGAQWAPTRHFTVREGLAQSQVTALTLDASGYLWVGTQGGLSRYDGRRFVTWTTVNGLPDDVVSALAADRDGSLWVGTDSGALARFDGASFGSPPGALPWRSAVSALAELAADRLAVGTGDGLYVLEGGSARRVLAGAVASLHHAEDAFWARVGSELFRVDRTGVVTPVRLPPGHGVVAVGSGRGELWVATDRGSLVRPSAGVTIAGLEPSADTAQSLLPAPEGGFWIGGARALWRRDGEGRVGEELLDPAERTVQISSLLADHEGTLWVGTWGQGLYQLNPGPTALFTTASGLPSSTVWSFSEDRDGCVLMGTEDAGVTRWCPGHGFDAMGELNAALPSRRVLVVAHDQGGTLWVGTNQGLVRRRPDGSTRLLRRADGLANDFIRAILPRTPDEVWIATSGGISRWDGASFRSWTEADGLPPGPVRGLAVDRSGSLWLATHSGGVVRFASGRLKAFTTRDGLPHNRVWSVAVDSRDRVWAGTDAGVWVHPLEGEGDRVVGLAAGLPNLNILFLVEDGEGFMWVGTTRGVSRVGPDLRVVRTFTAQDGFADSEAAENAALLDRSGGLWFGMSGGVTRLDPRRLDRNATPPPLVLRAVVVDGVPRTETLPRTGLDGVPALRLGPRIAELRFEFAALSYRSPDQVRFRFQLAGFDPGWSEPTEDDHVTFRRLPPGHYRFLVTACNNDGVWAPEPLALPLVVLPSWYQTLAFRVGAGVLLFGAAAGALGARVVASRRRQRELEAQVAARTAELQHANARISSQNRQLEELSRTDPLTSLANRRVLAEQLPLEMAVIRREVARAQLRELASYHGIGIVMADLDHFKEVNDRHGHEVGDRMLQAVAAGLVRSLRDVDLAVRVGGEEFLVLARGVDRSGLERLVERLQVAVASCGVETPEGEAVRLTASFGFLSYPLGVAGSLRAEEWPRLVEAADRLLYLAKSRGRMRACGWVWRAGAVPELDERQVLERMLRDPASPSSGMDSLESVVSPR